MRDFSQLLDALVYTRSRTAKLKLIGDYLKRTPDPDRGYALAALTGELNLPAVKPAAIRAIAEERVDPVLLYMSRDYVGDMAETISLLWPKPLGEPAELDDGMLRISSVVEFGRFTERLGPQQRNRFGHVADIVAAHVKQHRVDPLLGDRPHRRALHRRDVERPRQRG